MKPQNSVQRYVMTAIVSALLALMMTTLMMTTVTRSQAEADPITDIAGLVAASRAVIQEFSTQLQAELKQAIDAGGLVNAISICHTRAALIANAVSQESGFLVRRIALKPRNPRSVPDEWEKTVMVQFEARKAAGESVQALELAEIVEPSGGKLFRYVKAIPTGSLCLGCHGMQLPAEVAAKLDALYPNDQARGFREGDIRGAFSVLQLLQ